MYSELVQCCSLVYVWKGNNENFGSTRTERVETGSKPDIYASTPNPNVVIKFVIAESEVTRTVGLIMPEIAERKLGVIDLTWLAGVAIMMETRERDDDRVTILRLGQDEMQCVCSGCPRCMEVWITKALEIMMPDNRTVCHIYVLETMVSVVCALGHRPHTRRLQLSRPQKENRKVQMFTCVACGFLIRQCCTRSFVLGGWKMSLENLPKLIGNTALLSHEPIRSRSRWNVFSFCDSYENINKILQKLSIPNQPNCFLGKLLFREATLHGCCCTFCFVTEEIVLFHFCLFCTGDVSGSILTVVI